MAVENDIVVSADPKGHFIEGYLYEGTPKPGTCMQLQGTNHASGRPYYVVANIAADGEMCEQLILVNDAMQGQLVTDALVAGVRCFMYIPVRGDEVKVLFGNAAGTADDVAIGTKLIVDDGTGKFIPTTGSPEQEPCIALEAIVDPAADQLLLVRFL